MSKTLELIDQILATQQVVSPSGEILKLHSAVDPRGGELIARVCERVEPSQCVEVGMAYGLSALYIMAALELDPEAHLISIDPFQMTNWAGVGVNHVRISGHAHKHTLIEESSDLALAALVRNSQKVQLAFIDGMHTFDHALVDFFLIDKLLEVEGVVIFDDLGYSALQKLVRFILANRSYAVEDHVPSAIPRTPQWLKKNLKATARAISRTNLDLSRDIEGVLSALGDCGLIALRKLGDDSRPYNHFAGF